MAIYKFASLTDKAGLPVKCVATDRSRCGARLKLSGNISFAGIYLLRIPALAICREVIIVWQRDDEIGVRYLASESAEGRQLSATSLFLIFPRLQGRRCCCLWLKGSGDGGAAPTHLPLCRWIELSRHLIRAAGNCSALCNGAVLRE